MKIVSISKNRKFTKVTLIFSEEEWNQFKGEPVTDENYETVEDLLIKLGVKTSLDGFEYLKECMLYFKNNTNCNPAKIKITKELYPNVATKFENTTSTKVQRAINYAIRTSWTRANTDIRNIVFGSIKKKKLSSKEYITALAIYMRSCNF